MNTSTVYIAKSADVIGDVRIGRDSSIWYQAVVRGDHEPITIGERTNIQDACVLHTDKTHPIVVGNGVTVGHGVILHGCTIGDDTLIGMGAIILNGAKIGRNCLIGAGALVTQNTVIPDGYLAFGNPAKLRRELTEEELEHNRSAARNYVTAAKEQFESKLPE